MTVTWQTRIGIHQLMDGLNVEWLENGQIVMVTLTSTKREVMDEWQKTVMQIYDEWPAGDTVRIIFDVNQIQLTPYARELATNLFQYRLDLTIRVGIVLESSIFSQAIRMFVSRTGPQYSHREREFFTERAKAIAWQKADLSKSD